MYLREASESVVCRTWLNLLVQGLCKFEQHVTNATTTVEVQLEVCSSQWTTHILFILFCFLVVSQLVPPFVAP